jgi:hypothetical protein
MKSKILITILALFALLSCKREVTYIDLYTGEQVKLVQDSANGGWVNAETHKPVRLYVNTSTHDTIYGPTGAVVNNQVVHTSGGKYYYVDDEEWKAMNAPKPAAEPAMPSNIEKIKVEKDGDVKIKTKDGKIKIDGETGERKVKRD